EPHDTRITIRVADKEVTVTSSKRRRGMLDRTSTWSSEVPEVDTIGHDTCGQGCIRRHLEEMDVPPDLLNEEGEPSCIVDRLPDVLPDDTIAVLVGHCCAFGLDINP